MKDGRTSLAHKAEHAVDLDTGAIVGVIVPDADDGDTTTRTETLIEAAEQVAALRLEADGVQDGWPTGPSSEELLGFQTDAVGP